MKIGFALPNIGPVATADAITKVAQRAEALTAYSHRVTRALTGLAVNLEEGKRIDDPELSPLIRNTAALLENLAQAHR